MLKQILFVKPNGHRSRGRYKWLDGRTNMTSRTSGAELQNIIIITLQFLNFEINYEFITFVTRSTWNIEKNIMRIKILNAILNHKSSFNYINYC